MVRGCVCARACTASGKRVDVSGGSGGRGGDGSRWLVASAGACCARVTNSIRLPLRLDQPAADVGGRYCAPGSLVRHPPPPTVVHPPPSAPRRSSGFSPHLFFADPRGAPAAATSACCCCCSGPANCRGTRAGCGCSIYAN